MLAERVLRWEAVLEGKLGETRSLGEQQVISTDEKATDSLLRQRANAPSSSAAADIGAGCTVSFIMGATFLVCSHAETFPGLLGFHM